MRRVPSEFEQFHKGNIEALQATLLHTQFSCQEKAFSKIFLVRFAPLMFLTHLHVTYDRLCGLVVRVPGC
jgi:hypothetical protein